MSSTTPPSSVSLSTYDAGKISKVTLYADQAQVEREYDVELPAGAQSKVELLHLPSHFQQDSLRVEAFARHEDASLTILDVVILPLGPQSSGEKPSQELVELRMKLDLRRKAVQAIIDNQNLLSRYLSSASPANLKTDDLASLFSLNTTRSVEFAQRKAEIEQEIEQLVKEEEALGRKDGSGGQPAGQAQHQRDRVNGVRQRTVSILVLVESGSSQKSVAIKLKLSYLQYGASWSPTYEIQAKSPSAAPSEKSGGRAGVVIHYGASISNGTTEPWSDVPLYLSTASPLQDSRIPTLSPYRLGLPAPRPPPPPPARAYGGVLMASAPGPSMARMRKAVIHHDDGDDEEDDDDEFNDRAIFRGATVLDGSSAVVVMRVEGLVSAEADNSQHKVSLTDLSLEADLVYVAVPSLSSSAFLQATIKNTSDFPLLPGPTSIHLERSFVAKSEIEAVSPGEEFKISLGVDGAIKIVSSPEEKFKRAQGSLFGKDTFTEAFKQTVKFENTRSKPISLLVKSRFPVSEDSKIVVRPVLPGSSSSFPIRDGDGKGVTRWSEGEQAAGMVEWCGVVAAGRKMSWTIGWEVEGDGWVVK